MNIPVPTKIGSKMGGAPTPKWDPIGVDPQPFGVPWVSLSTPKTGGGG